MRQINRGTEVRTCLTQSAERKLLFTCRGRSLAPESSASLPTFAMRGKQRVGPRSGWLSVQKQQGKRSTHLRRTGAGPSAFCWQSSLRSTSRTFRCAVGSSRKRLVLHARRILKRFGATPPEQAASSKYLMRFVVKGQVRRSNDRQFVKQHAAVHRRSLPAISFSKHSEACNHTSSLSFSGICSLMCGRIHRSMTRSAARPPALLESERYHVVGADKARGISQ